MQKYCQYCPYDEKCDCRDSKFDCYLPDEAKDKIAVDLGYKPNDQSK